MADFSPGDLLYISVLKSGMTLVKYDSKYDSEDYLKERYHEFRLEERRYNPYSISMGYCWCLIESVTRNELGQAVDYGLIINGQKYKCRAKLAERYMFKL
jgi:hypothetical protein